MPLPRPVEVIKTSLQIAGSERKRVNEASPACVVLVSMVHYHNARLLAFAAMSEQKPAVIEISDRDILPVLECTSLESLHYMRYTLFPGTHPNCCDTRQLVRKLHDRLDKVRPSVICINGWSLVGSIASLEWALANNTPVVMMSDSTEWDKHRVWWKEFVKRRIVRLCGAGFVAGKPHVQYLISLGMPSERIFIGYDVVDNTYFAERSESSRKNQGQLRRRLGLPERYFFVCARFEETKNLERLLEAHATYHQRSGAKAWSLVIAGDGILKQKLIHLAKKLNIESYVVFAGLKRYDEIADYYALASGFVHASIKDTWGLVVNEAMAAGLPVLVSNRCGCAADLVHDGVNGYAFDPYDTNSLADLMVRMTLDSAALVEMGNRSREIISRWSPEAHAASLLCATEEAIRSSAPKPTILDKLLLRVLRYRAPENAHGNDKVWQLVILLSSLYCTISPWYDQIIQQAA